MSHQKIVAAIGAELQRRYADAIPQSAGDAADVTREMLECEQLMPDFLQFPMRRLTQVFNIWGIVNGGKRYQNLAAEDQAAQLDAWRNSRFELCRNFVRFYESLFLLVVMQEKAE